MHDVITFGERMMSWTEFVSRHRHPPVWEREPKIAIAKISTDKDVIEDFDSDLGREHPPPPPHPGIPTTHRLTANRPPIQLLGPIPLHKTGDRRSVRSPDGDRKNLGSRDLGVLRQNDLWGLVTCDGQKKSFRALIHRGKKTKKKLNI